MQFRQRVGSAFARPIPFGVVKSPHPAGTTSRTRQRPTPGARSGGADMATAPAQPETVPHWLRQRGSPPCHPSRCLRWRQLCGKGVRGGRGTRDGQSVLGRRCCCLCRHRPRRRRRLLPLGLRGLSNSVRCSTTGRVETKAAPPRPLKPRPQRRRCKFNSACAWFMSIT